MTEQQINYEKKGGIFPLSFLLLWNEMSKVMNTDLLNAEIRQFPFLARWNRLLKEKILSPPF